MEEPKPEKPDQPEDAGSKSQEATTTFVEMEIEDDPTENTSALVEVLQDTKAATTTTTGGSGFPGDGPGDGPGDDNGGGDPFDPKIPVKDPDTPAEYIGGTEARTNFLVSNLHPPSDNFEKTTISVQFVVDENGEISLAKVASKSINCQQCEEEALRVIRKMPRWKPAIKNNKKVASFFKISIVFETE